MKKLSIVVALAALFIAATAMAQTVQEGVTNLYSQRYQTARGIFEKLTAANPNNTEAVYWLGQTLIEQGDVAGAKALYQKTLAANGNAPWVLVGMGHINIIEGKAAEARQQFEAAILASKGKKGNDPMILNAVARANVLPYTDEKRIGDLDYAISKLNEASQLAPTNPDIFVTLGNAYRKKHIGGDAVQAYRKAGNSAPALYRTAMLWRSQNNVDPYLENLNAALAADPRFAPALYELYYYNLYKKDFTTAASFADKYNAAADPSPENLYLKAQTEFVQEKYTDAITTANQIISGTQNNPRPRVYRLLAQSYLRTKDTASACTNSNLFLSKASGEDVQGVDYILHARSCGKGNPDLIRADIMKAVTMDSVLSRQITTLNEAIEDARVNNFKLLQGELALISYSLRPNADKNELISSIAVPLYLGGNYTKADSVSKVYSAAAPDSIYGYFWSARSLAAIDTAMTQGLAIPEYEKALTVAEANKERLKSQGVTAATYLAGYTNNIKADKAGALAYANRGLAIDPTNATLLNIQKVLSAAPKQQAPAKQPAKTPAKPAGKAKR